MAARIVIISGANGTGKSGISRLLAERSDYGRAVHLHTDDFYQYIRKGYIAPWLAEAGDQNETVVESAAASARRFALDGYEVFVDGVIGPWFLEPWVRIAEEGADVRYVVLRPNMQVTIARAAGRSPKEAFPLRPEDIENVWRLLSDLGQYEAHALDTGALSIDESVGLIRRLLFEGTYRLRADPR